MRRWRKDWRRRGQLSRPNRRCVVRRLRRDGILQRRGLRIVLFVLAVLVWGATWQTRQRTANLGPWTCARIARPAGPSSRHQPLNGWLIIAMNVITVSVGGLSVFRVEHDDRGLWLSAGYGHPESFWGSDKHFVFVRPVSSSLKV